MKKIVFLDFDGVLNSEDYFRKAAREISDEDMLVGTDWMIDPEAVARINVIIAATGAEVVVSSTWRHRNSIEQLQELLNRRGFSGTVSGKTPPGGAYRGQEIAAWLQVWREQQAANNGSTDLKFVIIDDSDDMGELTHSLVRTSYSRGITDEEVVKVISVLGGV